MLFFIIYFVLQNIFTILADNIYTSKININKKKFYVNNLFLGSIKKKILKKLNQNEFNKFDCIILGSRPLFKSEIYLAEQRIV